MCVCVKQLQYFIAKEIIKDRPQLSLFVNFIIIMSLELKLQEFQHQQLPGGDLQGFVCFTWTSPFHKYVDYCNLISKCIHFSLVEGHIHCT